MPDTKDVELARKLVALSLFNPESEEATAAFKKARSLIKQHDIGPRAGDKVKDVVAAVKAAAADPETQKTIAAVRDYRQRRGQGVGGALKKAGGR